MGARRGGETDQQNVIIHKVYYILIYRSRDYYTGVLRHITIMAYNRLGPVVRMSVNVSANPELDF